MALGVDGGYDEGLAVEMELELLHDPGHKLQVLHIAAFPLKSLAAAPNEDGEDKGPPVAAKGVGKRGRRSGSGGGDGAGTRAREEGGVEGEPGGACRSDEARRTAGRRRGCLGFGGFGKSI